MRARTVAVRSTSAKDARGYVSPLKRRLFWALAGVVILLLIGSPAAHAESLCTDTWAGPAEGPWATAADWSTGKVPASAEVACIGSGKTVTLTGTQNVGVVQGEGILVIAGTLELTSALEGSQLAVVTMSGGVFKGVGTLKVTKAFH